MVLRFEDSSQKAGNKTFLAEKLQNGAGSWSQDVAGHDHEWHGLDRPAAGRVCNWQPVWCVPVWTLLSPSSSLRLTVHALCQTVIVAVYLISLMHFCEGEILQANIYLLEGRCSSRRRSAGWLTCSAIPHVLRA